MKGEELIVPNKQLTTMQVHNYGTIQQRRFKLNFGVIYECSLEQLQSVSSIVQSIIDEHPHLSSNWINMVGLGGSSIDYELDYEMNSADYATCLRYQEELLLQLIEKFREKQIEFAYPTQTVYVAQNDK